MNLHLVHGCALIAGALFCFVAFATESVESEAARFLSEAETQLAREEEESGRTQWVYSTNINHDTQWLAARARERVTKTAIRFAAEARRFDGVKLSDAQRRKLEALKLRVTLPASGKPGATGELTTIAARLTGTYSTNKLTLNDRIVTQTDAEKLMRELRDPAQLAEVWTRWHDSAQPMKADYAQLVALANEGATELGYADLGAMWRSGYDMSPADFAAEVDRLWAQIAPFYTQLHCYVRAKLNERYGNDIVPLNKPIRADLLGNMWAQEWDIDDIVIAERSSRQADLTAALTKQNYSPVQIVRTAERFYTSLGLPPLPQTFWERSQFVKPSGRETVCHASAANLDGREDLRVKLCSGVTATDFLTAHHELGHVYYSRAYSQQPFLFRAGANDGFHEAVGDLMILSVTPSYLQQLGLAADSSDDPREIDYLLSRALNRVAFIPFGLLVDKWRWQVYSGEVPPSRYNEAWWNLRRQYQGVRPPVSRAADGFDAGAKFHVAANVPYMRYFLARFITFQLYRSACDAAGWKGPLHRCSLNGSREVGRKLEAMLATGASQPWPEALEAFTGTRRIDGSALTAYFQPLAVWLKAQNRNRSCGLEL